MKRDPRVRDRAMMRIVDNSLNLAENRGMGGRRKAKNGSSKQAESGCKS
jgi:hypothetical protein